MADILALPHRQVSDLSRESTDGGLAPVRRLRGDSAAETADVGRGAGGRTGGRAGGSLAAIRATGLIRPASAPVDPADVERFLPVVAPLARLLPGGGLRRGSTVAVAPGDGPGNGPGATSLLLTLLAAASAAGSWCAVVGLPDLGLVAADEAGVELSRLALIASPGPDWVSVVAALLDGVEIVVAATGSRGAGGAVGATVAGRLAARARQRGSVLVPYGQWPGADLTLEVAAGEWHGLGQGRGRLRQQELEIIAYGRGAAARARRTYLRLPADARPAHDQTGPAGETVAPAAIALAG